jgi:hypothetical protein
MTSCYIGRGELFARNLADTGAGFLQISGESELTLTFTEEKIEISDARYGRKEVVSNFVSSTKGRVEAEIFSWKQENLKLLLGGKEAVTNAGSALTAAYTNPKIEHIYLLPSPKIFAVSIADANLNTLVAGVNYVVNNDYGEIRFLDLTGFTGPFLATYSNATSTRLGLNALAIPQLELMFRGVNKKTNTKLRAIFYRAQLVFPESVSFISKEFAKIPFKADLIADFSRHSDDTLSHYGYMVQI